MTDQPPPLPIDAVLPELLAALAEHGQAVLQAPPGAGKTTRVPLAMLEAQLTPGKVIMLEPRRLAARAAAERLAETLGQKTGQQVGYRMRGESKVSSDTRIEVVTEGVLTRMLQTDPELSGIGAVLFDEFHERSLNADLGLAMALEVRAALRPDLMLLVMSATLDAGPVAELMGSAPIITAEGRSYLVDLFWRNSPLGPKARLEPAVADTVIQAVTETDGGILVFLPGAREIGDVQRLLTQRFGDQPIDVRPLYGALPFAAQRAAIAPVTQPGRRKIVLATSIAETSLTIEDIRVVVDAGRARRSRFDPGSGMSRLVTERVTKAEATQRAGRAGRVAKGTCYKLWTKGEDGALAAFPPAEIEAADLAGLALELAAWGTTEDDLAFLTKPPAAAMAEARALLHQLHLLTDGRLTDHGRRVAALPLHPRLGHMAVKVGPKAALPAALLAGRDPMTTRKADLSLRVRAIEQGDKSLRGLSELKAEAKRIAGLTSNASASYGLGEMAALAYPDRVGKRRKGDDPRYILSGGRGAVLDSEDSLGNQPFLVATDLDGAGRDARIRMAVAITEGEVRSLFGDQITSEQSCTWSKRNNRVIAEEREMLGAVTLSSKRWTDADPEQLGRAMCDGIRQLGLRLSGKAALFRSRVELVRHSDTTLPAMTDDALMADLETWLLPHLSGITTAEHWKAFDASPALQAMLSWDQTDRLNKAAPPHFTTPLDRKVPIDYGGEAPEISLRLQEMFGVTTHPTVGNTPLRVTLLSPAGRPVQTTTDIPAFWASSYADVRKDMRGRYPRHPWPEDPTQADPTLRTKRRQT